MASVRNPEIPVCCEEAEDGIWFFDLVKGYFQDAKVIGLQAG
jgi:hypothetical protein